MLLAATISALLAGALVHLFAGALDLSRTARQQASERQDAQLAVSLLHHDIRQATRVLKAGDGLLTLLGASQDTIFYGWSAAGTDTLARWTSGDTPQVLAGAVDSLRFSVQTVTRPFTTELLLPDTSEAVVMSFYPGDWDEWIGQTVCEYESRGDRRIEDKKWCAEEFWPDENFNAFSRVTFVVWAKDHFPAEVDLIVEVYEADSDWPWYPATLLAAGGISRLALTEEPAWHETTLTLVTNKPIVAGGHYWLVLRPDGSGGGTYAGHVELERVKNCDEGQWPGTEYRYRKSDDGGTKWSDETNLKDFFFDIRGWQTRQKLTEVTTQVVDTLGVIYRLKIGAAEEPERRAGFVALEDL